MVNRKLCTQVHCTTLHDVINHFVEQTDGVLIPLIIEEPYEKTICMSFRFHIFTCTHEMFSNFPAVGQINAFLFTAFIKSDNENGEKSVQQALLNSTPPSVPPKPGTVS